MAYMHRETFEIFQGFEEMDTFLQSNEDYFHIDDLIAPPVQVLNRKGYTTEFCCSGHPFCLQLKEHDNVKWNGKWEELSAGNSGTEAEAGGETYRKRVMELFADLVRPELRGYIVFMDGVSLPSLPPGFAVKGNDPGAPPDNRLKITKSFDDKGDIYALMREITDTMERLYHWALSLPDKEDI